MIDFDKIDKIIHEKGRLAIMSLLASRMEWSFQDLKAQLKMSDGNLITHLRTLQTAGYVTLNKGNEANRPKTNYFLTDGGRTAFQEYLKLLEAILHQSREG